MILSDAIVLQERRSAKDPKNTNYVILRRENISGKDTSGDNTIKFVLSKKNAEFFNNLLHHDMLKKDDPEKIFEINNLLDKERLDLTVLNTKCDTITVNIVIHNMPFNYNLDESSFIIGKYSFDSKFRNLKYQNEEPVKISPKTNQLLKMLVFYSNITVPRKNILEEIWKEENFYTAKSMDVYISKLRKLLAKDNKIKIINLSGEGFQLNVLP